MPIIWASEDALEGLSNFHRVILKKTLDLSQDSAEFAATNMRIRMPHASFKSAEGVHTVGPVLKSGAFGAPEVSYTAETDDTAHQSAVRYFYRGTGLWGPFHRKYGAVNAKALLFKRHDGGNFTSVVKGQRPQQEWFQQSKVATGNYTRLKIETMLKELQAQRTF